MCATPATVYEMTNGDGIKAVRGAPDSPVTKSTAVANEPERGSVDAAIRNAATKPQYADPQTSQPLREPARVMRIWVKPWIDTNDDLHWPSYVYTEVVPRKWTVGKKEFAAMHALNVPHFSSTPDPSPSASAKGSPTNVRPQKSAVPPAALPAVDSIPLN